MGNDCSSHSHMSCRGSSGVGALVISVLMSVVLSGTSRSAHEVAALVISVLMSVVLSGTSRSDASRNEVSGTRPSGHRQVH